VKREVGREVNSRSWKKMTRSKSEEMNLEQ
jgi:hypothetical protein